MRLLINSKGVTCKSCSPRSKYDTSFSSVCTPARAACALSWQSARSCFYFEPNWLNFCLLGFGLISPRYLKRNWGSKQLSWAIVTAWGSSKQPDCPTQPSWGLAKGTGTRGESGICCLLEGSGWAGLARTQGKFSLESLMSQEREEGCHCPRKKVVNRVSCSAYWRVFPSESFVTFSHGK